MVSIFCNCSFKLSPIFRRMAKITESTTKLNIPPLYTSGDASSKKKGGTNEEAKYFEGGQDFQIHLVYVKLMLYFFSHAIF